MYMFTYAQWTERMTPQFSFLHSHFSIWKQANVTENFLESHKMPNKELCEKSIKNTICGEWSAQSGHIRRIIEPSYWTTTEI